MFMSSLFLRTPETAISINFCLLPQKKLWRAAIVFIYLFFAQLTVMSATALAQQGNVSIDSFRVLNATPGFVDIELVGSNHASPVERIWLGAIAKAKDDTAYSENFQPFLIPAEKQFHLMSRVQRPYGLGAQQTDFLEIMVYPEGKAIILRRKFDWTYIWPEKAAKLGAEAVEYPNLGAGYPWRIFRDNYYDEEFEALDVLMNKWNSPKERDVNGEWKLGGFRTFLGDYFNNIHDWKSLLKNIKRWREFNPRSAGAAIVEARYWEMYAWNIRGDESEEDADPVALRVFGERMQRAEKVLKDAKSFSADNPLWYAEYLDVAVATKRDGKLLEALFNEAIRKHPNFQPLYLGMAKYWVPLQGYKANWGKADEVIRLAAANTANMDGKGNYAMLYAQLADLQGGGFDIFKDSYVLWTKMRDSFEDLVKHYPSMDNLNEFAAFACRANDKRAFLGLRPRILNRIVPDKWLDGYSYDLCDRRFMQQS